MSYNDPFSPHQGASNAVTAAVTSASVTVNKHLQSLRVSNAGTVVCHVRVGDGAQTATTADTAVLPGESVILRKAVGDDTVAYRSASSTAALYIQAGEGGG